MTGTVLIYSILAALCAFAAYWVMFGGWQGFDDEGFFEYSLKAFVGGRPLYSSVYSEYGPFYYLLFGGFFKLTGLALTTQAGRTISVVIWVVSSLGFGLGAHAFTRSLGAGVATMLSTFSLLSWLASSPMHAQVLVALLTMVIVLLALTVLIRPGHASPFALGVVMAALMMTKVNLGIYASVAFVFASVMVSSTWLRRRATLGAAAVGFVLLGPILMHSEWHIYQERVYAIAVGLSALGLALTAWPHKKAVEPDFNSERVLLWWIGGFTACVGLVLILMLILGGSLGAWFQETIDTPSHQARFLNIPLDTDGKEALLGGVGVACALILRAWPSILRLPSRSVGLLGTWSPVLAAVARVAVGLVILLPASNVFPFRNLPYPYLWAWPFVWVVAAPGDPRRSNREQFVRVLLPALAITQSLMAFPIAGSQVVLGGMMFPLCGAICLVDGARHFRRSGNRLPRAGSVRIFNRLPTAVAALIPLLAALIFYVDIAQPFAKEHRDYERYAPLGTKGAAGVRAPADLTRDLRAIVAVVHRHHCATLLEIPGQFSFNLWTGLDTPDPLTGQQPYWESLTDAQQERLLRSSRAAPAMCLLYDEAEINFYTFGQPLPRTPLLIYLQDDFRTVKTIASWQVQVRKRGG